MSEPLSLDPLADFDREILDFLESAGIPREAVQLDTPDRREFGERSTNIAMQLARERKQAPRQIATEIAGRFNADAYRLVSGVEVAGAGFINFRLNYAAFAPLMIDTVREAGAHFGRRPSVAPIRVVVEHTSVNPNKEWHIGHVRNAVLGDVVTRVLRLVGHEVEVQNYIDDTGLQAAQAVFALNAFPEPHQSGEKYDHYVGRAYVKIAAEIAAEKDLKAELETLPPNDPRRFSVEARLENIERLKAGILGTMHALEEGEQHDVVGRILDAQLMTAFRLGIFYDLLNWESHLVQSGLFEEAIRALEQSPTVRRPTEGRYAGALVIETGPDPEPGEERKAEVLIRRNGIPTYVGKDIAYHMWKFAVLPDRLAYVDRTVQPNGTVLRSTSLTGTDREAMSPDRVINIIAVDQSQAQDAVRQGLRVAGYPRAAENLIHLAYGLVTTREGRISGRKGTSASGDSVIEQAVGVAYDRVQEKRSQDLTDEDMRSIAEAVGVGALRYFMVQYNPMREIVFDVSDVVSYDGNTGLYVQYALVRMFAILRRARDDHGIADAEIDAADTTLLQHEQEKRLLFHLAQYPELVATAARTLAINLVAEYAFELATIFSQFYRDCGVLNADPPLRAARLLLVSTVRDVLVNASGILGVPVIERL